MSIRLNLEEALYALWQAALQNEGLPENLTAKVTERTELPYQALGEDNRRDGSYETGTSTDDAVDVTVRLWDTNPKRLKKTEAAMVEALRQNDVTFAGGRVVTWAINSANRIDYPRAGDRTEYQIPLDLTFEVEHT